MGKISAKEVQVKKLFSSDYLFEIPIYQRPLSWGSEEFNLLFEDIKDSLETGDSQYFLGSIILKKKDDIKYDIVDGQQRLSALTILMAVMRDIIENEKQKNSLQSCIFQEEDEFKEIPEQLRIEPWEGLKETFKNYIYEEGGTNQFLEKFRNNDINYNDKQDPKYHLYESIQIFKKKMEEVENLEKFYKYLLNNVYMVRIYAEDLSSAFRLFTVLNTRGMSLKTSDLLKSENLGEVESPYQEEYSKKWRDIEESLGRNELEDLIGHIRTTVTKEKAKKNLYKEYNKLFNNGYLKKGEKFIDLVYNYSEIYYNKILQQNFNPRRNETRHLVDLMKRFMPFSDWIPPVLEFYNRFKDNEKLAKFILKMEKKAVIEWSAGFTPTERITSFNRILKLINEKDDPEDVLNEFFTYESKSIMGRKSRTVNYNEKGEVKKILKEKLNDSNFYTLYGGNFSKYLLLRADMEMWEMENFSGYKGMLTIEHVLPRNPPEGSEWVKIFNDEERKEWANKLGNLVLLSGRKNSKAKNYDFKKKKNAYFGKKWTAFRSTQKLKEYEEWNLDNLKARHKELVNSLVDLYLDY